MKCEYWNLDSETGEVITCQNDSADRRNCCIVDAVVCSEHECRCERAKNGRSDNTNNKPMPLDRVRFNGGQRCDMLVGPCACGAWHKSEDRL